MTDADRSNDDPTVPWRPQRETLELVCVSLLLALSVAAGGALAVSPAADTASLADQSEANNGFDQATPLEAPFEYESLDANEADDDYYAVDLARGDIFEVSITFAHADGDLDLIVHDPNRDVVASSHSFTDDEHVSLQARVDGTYYVRVTSWNETATSYGLSGTRSDGDLPANDELEYNDGFTSATPITAPFDRAELRITEQDVDVYAVDLEADHRLSVASRFDNDQADVDLEVYDPDQNILAVSATSTDNESLSTRADEAGTYFVRVNSESAGLAYYTLRVGAEPASSATRTASSADDATPDDDSTPTEDSRSDTTTEPSADLATPTDDDPAEQRQMESEQRATTDQPTGAIGPGFGVFAVLAAIALVVLGRRW